MTGTSGLGRIQRMALGRMRRHGGRWYPGCGWVVVDNDYRTNEVMKSLLWRGLVCVKVRIYNDLPRAEYVLLEEGKQMADEKKLDPVEDINWETLDPKLMDFEVHVATIGKTQIEGQQIAVVGTNLPWSHGIVALTGGRGMADEAFAAKCAFLFAAAPKLYRALEAVMTMPHQDTLDAQNARFMAFTHAAEALRLAEGAMSVEAGLEGSDGQSN